jgi:predicted lipoprotein with Yx(FWY)xxD motif
MRAKCVPVLLPTLLAMLIYPAFAQPAVKSGLVLTHTGHSLYTFDNDVPGSGTSVCNPPCSNIFPPYTVADKEMSKGGFAFVIRQDGSRQWAYKGRPLYRFYADEKPGDQGGDGMNRNLWHVARE